MKGRLQAAGILLGILFFPSTDPAFAGGRMLLSSAGVSDAGYADLIVRKVTVTPIRAHAGDPIRIEVVWIYWGQFVNTYYEATSANVLANGKVVASVPFSYEFGANPGDEYRHTFVWDTRGVPPGRYRIRAEVPLRLDATPYDNFLDLRDPVTLLPERAVGTGDEKAGGSAVTENRYWWKTE